MLFPNEQSIGWKRRQLPDPEGTNSRSSSPGGGTDTDSNDAHTTTDDGSGSATGSTSGPEDETTNRNFQEARHIDDVIVANDGATQFHTITSDSDNSDTATPTMKSDSVGQEHARRGFEDGGTRTQTQSLLSARGARTAQQHHEGRIQVGVHQSRSDGVHCKRRKDENPTTQQNARAAGHRSADVSDGPTMSKRARIDAPSPAMDHAVTINPKARSYEEPASALLALSQHPSSPPSTVGAEENGIAGSTTHRNAPDDAHQDAPLPVQVQVQPRNHRTQISPQEMHFTTLTSFPFRILSFSQALAETTGSSWIGRSIFELCRPNRPPHSSADAIPAFGNRNGCSRILLPSGGSWPSGATASLASHSQSLEQIYPRGSMVDVNVEKVITPSETGGASAKKSTALDANRSTKHFDRAAHCFGENGPRHGCKDVAHQQSIGRSKTKREPIKLMPAPSSNAHTIRCFIRVVPEYHSGGMAKPSHESIDIGARIPIGQASTASMATDTHDLQPQATVSKQLVLYSITLTMVAPTGTPVATTGR